MEYTSYIENQEKYFKNGKTLPISKRKKLLKLSFHRDNII